MSESRSGESRSDLPKTNESSIPSIKLTNVGKYNNMIDIDTLIEKLESEIPLEKTNNLKINQALEERRKKIEQLKKIREDIKRNEEEERILSQTKKSNDELDEFINNVKKLIAKPTTSIKSSTSESRSGESRW